MTEPQRAADAGQLGELGRGVEACHGHVGRGGPQILADGHEVGAGGAQVAQRGDRLVPGLAEAHHDAGLGDLERVQPLGAGEEREGAVVAAAGARHPVEPRHRLEVVIEDVGARRHHRAQRVLAPLEVRDQQFDGGFRHPKANLPHDRRVVRRAAVGDVVAVHRCHHDVAQRHRLHRLREPARFPGVQGQRRAVRHRAVGAVPRADVAHDQEGGRPVVPALAHVGAVRLLADGVELQFPHQAADLDVARPARGLHLEPAGLAGGRLGCRGDPGPAGRDLEQGNRLVFHWQRQGKPAMGRGPVRNQPFG